VVLTGKTRITKISKKRVRLVFQGVAALAENMMDGPLRAPKAGALPTALHPVIKFFRVSACVPKPPALPTAPHPEIE